MLNPSLALLAALFIAASALLLLVKKAKHHVILDRLHSQRRRFSDSKTPPRSFSPEKGVPNSVLDYSNVFPPSRREALAHVPGFAAKLGKTSDALVAPIQDKICVPLTTELHDASKNMCTPCEFTVQEIEALGDFPDYATLSGIPLPRPYFEFDIKKAIPRPYRPFRWAYHQTMSLTKMEPDWWLELESTYEERLKQRKAIYKKEGKNVLDTLPGSNLACKELMEMCLQFLCARYPQYFRLDTDTMTFFNGILQTESNLKTSHPLNVIFDNVPEDFAIMLRDPETGLYSFRAGTICSALGWNVNTKIGKTLPEIHAPVPDYKEKMQFSMDRYFTKKPTDRAIQRGSWGLEVDQPLYMPPGDPHEKLRDFQSPGLDISRCNLRVDWQTLRRLPLSGAVVFNFKALFTPLEEFRNEPFVPALVLRVLNEAKPNLMAYKNTWHTEHVVKPALDRWAREQVANGVVPGDWEPHTLDDSPWFPGWEEKWHRQQGF